MSGKRIRNLRKRLGLTQPQMAARLGVNVATVCRWERERHDVSPMAVRALRALEKESRR